MIEAIVVVDAVTVAIFDALRTQLSKLDTKVSSGAATTQPGLLLVVEGDAALYSVAEVICLPMASGIMAGSGDTAADDALGSGLPPKLLLTDAAATADTSEDAVMSSC